MDITKIPELPIEMLKGWLELIDTEIQHTDLVINDLKLQIDIRKSEQEIAEQFKSMIRMAIALQELLEPVAKKSKK